MGPLAAFALPAAGSALGGLFGKLFGGGGGGKDDKDRKLDRQLAPYLSDLNASSTSLRAQGDELSGMGNEALQPLLQYFQALVGGDPNALMAATQPERARVIDQYDTARKSIGEFGGRGGGANRAMADSQFSQANTLSNITAFARRDAAGQLGSVSTTLQGLGLSADQLASHDLNTIINTLLNKEGIDTQRRGQNAALAGGLAEGMGTLLGLLLTRGNSGGGGAA